MGLFALSVFETPAPLKEAMLMLILPYAALSFGSGPNPLHRYTQGVDISYGLFLWGFPSNRRSVISLGRRLALGACSLRRWRSQRRSRLLRGSSLRSRCSDSRQRRGYVRPLPPEANRRSRWPNAFSTEIAMDRASRANNFDLLRLFGAILVIYGHSYAMVSAVTPSFAANGVATIGVKVLLFDQWISRGVELAPITASVLRFFWRRILRIFPALAIVVALCAFVMGPIVTTVPLSEYFRAPMTFEYLGMIALRLQDWLPGVFIHNPLPRSTNGSLWSVPAECTMYLLTPAVLIAASLAPRKRTALCIAVLVLAILSLWLWYYSPPKRPFVVLNSNLWVFLAVAPYFWIGALFAVCGFDRYLNIYLAFMGLFALAVFQTPAIPNEAMLMLILPLCVPSFGSGPNPLHHLMGELMSPTAYSCGAFPSNRRSIISLGSARPLEYVHSVSDTRRAPIALPLGSSSEADAGLKNLSVLRGQPAPA